VDQGEKDGASVIVPKSKGQ